MNFSTESTKESSAIKKTLKHWTTLHKFRVHDFDYETCEQIANAAINLHKFYQLTDKKKLHRLACENNLWTIFNNYFPFTCNLEPKQLIENYLPLTTKKLQNLLSANSNSSIYLNLYSLNASSLIISLLIGLFLGKETNHLFIILENETYQIFSSYIQGLESTGSNLTHIKIINLTTESLEKYYTAFKEGGVFVGIMDIPPALGDKTTYSIQVLNQTFTIQAKTINLAAQFNIPLIPLVAFFHNNQLIFQPYNKYSISLMDLKPSVASHTLEKIFSPLNSIFSQYPEKWLQWHNFNSFNPIFATNIFSKSSPPKSLIQTRKLFWLTNKQNTFIVNLESGKIFQLFSPLFNILCKSNSAAKALKQSHKKGISINEAELIDTLSLLN